LIILVCGPLIEEIPVASLTGLMFVVVVKTFYWESFFIFKKLSKFEFFIILLVTLLTVVFDLAVAVIIGVFLSACYYTWDRGYEMKAKTMTKKNSKGIKMKIYQFQGDLMFSSI